MDFAPLKQLVSLMKGWQSRNKKISGDSPPHPCTPLTTPTPNFSRVDPATFGRNGRDTFNEIVRSDRPRHTFTDYDFALNSLIVAPVVKEVFNRNPAALQFYEDHKLLHIDGIPAWAGPIIANDAIIAYRGAFTLFDQYMQRMDPGSRSLQSFPGIPPQPLEDLGLGYICSYTEAKGVLAHAKTIRRSLNPVFDINKTSVISGAYRLDDKTSFGTRACSSFGNRASQMLIASLLFDLSNALQEHFRIPDEMLKDIFIASTNLNKLFSDRRVTNALYYAEFFKQHPDIPLERRQVFVNTHLSERLHALAVEVEFCDLLPAIEIKSSALTDPEASRQELIVTQPIISPPCPTISDQLNDPTSPEVLSTDPLLALLIAKNTPTTNTQQTPEKHLQFIRRLIRQNKLTYTEIYTALLTRKEATATIIEDLVAEKQSASKNTPQKNTNPKLGRTIHFFTKQQGERCPFEEWFKSLHKDDQSKIETRLDTIENSSHLGDTKPLTGYPGVFELRFGGKQGLRVYYSYAQKNSIVIWTGGHHDDQDFLLEKIDTWRKLASKSRK